MPEFRSCLAILALFSAAAMHAQTPAPAADMPTFEVAAIKPNNTGSGNSSSNSDKGLFTAENVTLKGLMQWEAYDIPPSRILGGPKWLDSAHFDVRAKLDQETAARLDKLNSADRRTQNQAIFQRLLAERFQLKVHWETRQLPIYALVATKGGAKLTPADPKEGSGTSSSGNGTTTKFKATSQTFAEFAQSLTTDAQGDLGRVVVDQTGIQGKYDFALNWTLSNAHHDSGADTSADTAPTLFTAIQEQLGLKLESSKGPVQVLVIDQAELPTEN